MSTDSPSQKPKMFTVEQLAACLCVLNGMSITDEIDGSPNWWVFRETAEKMLSAVSEIAQTSQRGPKGSATSADCSDAEAVTAKADPRQFSDDKRGRHDPKRTKEQFDEIVGNEGGTPLERLRLFCSLGLNGDDWLDVEPFFDAVEKQLSDRSATGTSAEIKQLVTNAMEELWPSDPKDMLKKALAIWNGETPPTGSLIPASGSDLPFPPRTK